VKDRFWGGYSDDDEDSTRMVELPNVIPDNEIIGNSASTVVATKLPRGTMVKVA